MLEVSNGLDSSALVNADKDKVAEIIIQGARELGISLPPDSVAAFEAYYSFLEKCGHTTNLTAIAGPGEVAKLHFLDSIALVRAAQMKNLSVIDIGSGAGFPGIPIKLAEPSISLTLLDATNKRVRFLSDLCSILRIKAACIYARAEEAAHYQDMRERYDVAISRAVARLNALCELCLPFVHVGGMFIAMKGVDSTQELADSIIAIETLGAQFQECFDYTIPGTDIIHRAIIIRKLSSTSAKYPRRYPKILKDPL